MKFSIICPCYNSEKWVFKAIESVINQTYIDWELILINDGSKDLTLKIIKKYNENILNKIKFDSISNTGPFYARLRGVEISSGNYLLFLDSDDYLDTNALSKLNHILEEKSVDFIVFSFLYIFKNTNKEYHCVPNENLILFNSKTDFLSFIYRDNHYFTGLWNKCFSNKIKEIDKCILQEFYSLRNGEDYIYFALILNKLNSFIFIDDILYNYTNINPSSLISSHNDYDSLIYNKLYIQYRIYNILMDSFNDETKTKFLYICWTEIYYLIIDIYKAKIPFNKKKQFFEKISFYKDTIFLLKQNKKKTFKMKLFSFLHKNKFFRLLNLIIHFYK